MTGVSLKIDISGFSKLNRVMDSFGRGLKNKQALNLAIATTLRETTRKRFATKKTPDGKNWSTPLVKHGDLRGKLLIAADDNVAKVGSNLVYAAIHQFGGEIKAQKGKVLKFSSGGKILYRKKVTIKANPYLGLSESDEDAIVDTIKVYAEEALKE